MAAYLRLDKIIADTGAASRRDVVSLIRHGCVTVNGVTVRAADEKFDPSAIELRLNGELIEYRQYHYLMMNKPSGYISATEDKKEKTVTDLLEERFRRLGLFPAGRLDKDAEGLILLTNDGDFAHRIISPKKNVDKKYFIETEGALNAADCIAFEKGIVLKDGLKCMPARLEILDSGSNSHAYVIIREGKYHQVKRMIASLGKHVSYLKRIAIGGLELDRDLKTGEYRYVTSDELEKIFLESAAEFP